MKLAVVRTLPKMARISTPVTRSRAFRVVPVLAQKAEGGSNLTPAPRSSALGFPSMAVSPLGTRFRQLEDEMDQMMRAFFPTASLTETMPALREGGMSLAVDVRDEGNKYLIAADLPGMARDDINVKVTPDGVLHITGERKHETKEEDEGGFVRIERSYGSFSRQFRLPDHVDASGIKAELKNGVLELSVPKKEEEEVKAQTIAIEVGEGEGAEAEKE
jgi:HSP20 family protein